MASLHLNKFCCCCTTRTGALVIGTLGWILTLLQIFGAVDPRRTAQDQKVHRELVNEIYGKSDYTPDYNYSLTYFKIGYGLVTILVCILLIVGVYKKDKRYMLPWLVFKGFEVTILGIVTALLFVFACIHGAGVLFAIFFVCLIAMVLHSYFWLCIWSHYKDLEEGPAENVVTYSTTNSPPPQYMEKSQNMV